MFPSTFSSQLSYLQLFTVIIPIDLFLHCDHLLFPGLVSATEASLIKYRYQISPLLRFFCCFPVTEDRMWQQHCFNKVKSIKTQFTSKTVF